MKVQARASGKLPSSSILVFYGRDWEDCEQADSLTMAEAQEIIASFERDDRLSCRELLGHSSMRRLPHQYRIVCDDQQGE